MALLVVGTLLPTSATIAQDGDPVPTLDAPTPRLLAATSAPARQEGLRSTDVFGRDPAQVGDQFISFVGGLDVAADGSQVTGSGRPLHRMELSDVWGRPYRALAPNLSGRGVFSPEGGAIAYHQDGRVHVVDLDDDKDRVVATDPDPVFPEDDADQEVYVFLEWATTDWLLVDYSAGTPEDTPHSRGMALQISTGRTIDREDVPVRATLLTPDGKTLLQVAHDEYECCDEDECCDAQLVAHEPSDYPSLSSPRWTRPYTWDDSPSRPVADHAGVHVAVELSSTVEVLRLDDGSVVSSRTFPGRAIQKVAWSPDGSRLAVSHVPFDPDDPNRSEGVTLVTTRADGSDPITVFEDAPGNPQLIGWAEEGALLIDPQYDPDQAGREDVAVMRVVESEGGTRTIFSLGEDTFYFNGIARPRLGPVDRYAGATRITTAVELSRTAFDAATTVVVARADLYPDALAGAALAGRVDGPLLLTAPERLAEETVREVARLGATRAFLLGTADVVGDGVVDDLEAAGIEVVRLGGATRFDTAALVAAEVAPDDGEIYLVEGQNGDPNRGWPDAVAVASRAAAEKRPILLTDRDALPAATRKALRDLDVARVTIVGGEVAVSRAVAEEIRGLGIEVRRIAGDTRYDTSAQVVRHAGAVTLPFIVTGANWPDALAAGPAAAHVGGQVLLAPADSIVGTPAESIIADSRGVTRVAVVGSTAVVSQRVVRELRRALD